MMLARRHGTPRTIGLLLTGSFWTASALLFAIGAIVALVAAVVPPSYK